MVSSWKGEISIFRSLGKFGENSRNTFYVKQLTKIWWNCCSDSFLKEQWNLTSCDEWLDEYDIYKDTSIHDALN